MFIEANEGQSGNMSCLIPTTLTEEESTLLTDLFFDQIDTEACRHGDWVNNEGGYGRFTVCTDTAQFEMDYNQRTVINAFYNGPSIYS